MIRKLLIGASALALSAGTANAQSVVFGDDDASPNTVEFQIGSPSTGPNNSAITQNSDNNSADVDQTGGSRNSSVIFQGNGTAGSGDNAASVTQSTGGGAVGNAAKIVQIGTDSDNTGSIPGATPSGIPSGKDQNAVITQHNNYVGDSSNLIRRNDAVIYQGSAGAGGLQNYASIDQFGQGNEAGIQQGARAAGLTDDEDGRMQATITQRGRYNIAETAQGEVDKSDTTQTGGDYNEAYVSQAPASGKYGRVSDVDQTGHRNMAFVSQTGIEANSDIDQLGNDNIASVDQSGNSAGGYNAVSVIYQDGDRNDADVTQTANADSDVNQDGNRNEAVVFQSGARAESDIVQDGSRNEADVNQSGEFAKSDVDQDGNGNMAYVVQSGARADSEIDQTGNLNTANVKQYAADGTSTVTQTGSSNFLFWPIDNHQATVTQNAGANNADSDVTQSGNVHTATVTQNASYNDSDVTQTGRLNTATVNQNAGSDYAASEIIQGGNGNFATVGQSGAGDTGSSVPESFIEQIGLGNSATLTQGGDLADSSIRQGFVRGGGTSPLSSLNSATVVQAATAENASSDIYQAGLLNTALVTQSGDSAISQIDQIGWGNDTIVVQSSNANSDVFQDGDLNDAYVNQSGVGAESDITQTGDRNYSNVIQSGLNADSEITQTGYRNTSLVTQSVDNVESIIDQAGNGNYANVLQTMNHTSYSNISQTGNGNVANVSQ